MYKKTRWGFALLALVIAFGVWVLSKVPIQFGIDLYGGTELTYRLDLSRVETDREEVAEKVKEIISNRLNTYGLKEISVSVQGEDQLVVQLPGQGRQSVDQLKQQVETAGKLEFRLVATNAEQSPEKQEEYKSQERNFNADLREWIQKKRDDPNLAVARPVEPRYIVRELVDKDEDDPTAVGLKPTGRFYTLVNTPEGIVSGEYLTRVGATVDQQTFAPAVAFEFSGDGARAFGELTGPNKGRSLAITLDNDVMQVATIEDRITSSGVLRGKFTDADVQGVVTILAGGSLPTKPELLSEMTVGSVLGEDSIRSSLQAMIFAMIGVMLIMMAYYLASGVVANFALCLNIFFLLTYVACFRQTLTLPGVAGILLTVGMAVDANILIFERVREERKKGKTLLQSLTTGYQRAFWVIFDANLTTLITGFVLFNFGTGPVKGFAVTLISGIAISFVTAVFVTRLVLSLMHNIGLVKELKMLQAFDTPNVRFVSKQRAFLAVSTLIVFATWIFVVYRGEDNYGIDFTGGARINVQLKRPIPVSEMKAKIAALQEKHPDLFRDYSLQTLATEADDRTSARSFALRTRTRTDKASVANAQEAAGTQGEAGGVGSPVGTPQEGTPPAGGAPVEAPAGVGTPVASGAASDGDPAQQVRGILEKLLQAEDLLLPSLTPVEEWESAEGVGNAGREYLVVEANLIPVDDPTTSEQGLKRAINEFFGTYDLLKPSEDGTFNGLEVSDVKLVQKAGEDGIERYRFTTTPYAAPLDALRENTAPTHGQVEEAFQQFFHTHGPGASATNSAKLFDVSDPFPAVATVGPRVASGLQADAVVALFISILGIIFYISLRFEFIFGVAAIVALLHDILISIGIIAVVDHFFGSTFPVKINLAELAAILTIIGYSINDTIVVFDRIRENMRVLAKKRLPFSEIVNLSINQTLTRTLWTSVTTLLVTLVLLFSTTESVRGFAFIFAIGVVTGTYSSIFVASPVLLYLQKRAVARRETIAAIAS